jgi:hypothetical protein
MKRTNTYLGTFDNTPDGIKKYIDFQKEVRSRIRGGRFVKMFRNCAGKGHRATKPRDGSTHFDVYMLGVWSGERHSRPVEIKTGRTLDLW